MIVNCKLLSQNCYARGCDKHNNTESRKPITQQNKKPVASRIHVLYFLEQNDKTVIHWLIYVRMIKYLKAESNRIWNLRINFFPYREYNMSITIKDGSLPLGIESLFILKIIRYVQLHRVTNILRFMCWRLWHIVKPKIWSEERYIYNPSKWCIISPTSSHLHFMTCIPFFHAVHRGMERYLLWASLLLKELIEWHLVWGHFHRGLCLWSSNVATL